MLHTILVLAMAEGRMIQRGARVAAAVVLWAAGCLFEGDARAEVVITVDKALQRMFVVVDGEHRYTWPVSTGIGNTPSGSFRAQLLSRHHRSTIFGNAPMPYAVFYNSHYAIHGTTAIGQLGTRASKGCVRLHPSNAAVLFALVQQHGLANTQVNIQVSAARVAQR
jgi:lipoprotein-anchoring transpeptidase ErfK/SrfK